MAMKLRAAPGPGRVMVRKPEPNRVSVKPTAPPRQPEADETEIKSVTVRMNGTLRQGIENTMRKLDCDKSEVVKRGVRLVGLAYGAHNAKLVISDASGVEQTVPLVKSGVPCS